MNCRMTVGFVPMAMTAAARLGLLFALMASQAEAACHIFSIWHYTWPQRCGTAAPAGVEPANRSVQGSSRSEPEIALPMLSLGDVIGGDADGAMRARLLVHARRRAAGQ